MALGGINLSPSPRYIQRYKNGRLNLAGTINNVIHDLSDGEIVTSASMGDFLRECGVSVKNVQSSMASLSRREPILEKQIISDYYRIKRDDSTIDFSAKK